MSSLDERLSAGLISRYHTVDCPRKQSVAEHSWGVAVILMEIVPTQYIGDYALLRAALVHDMAELHTGDVPAHVKWANPTLKAELDRIETKVEQEMGVEIDLDPGRYQLLKVADLLELVYHAVRQLRLGNTNYRVVFDRGVEWLLEHKDWMPEKAATFLSYMIKEVRGV